MPSTPPADAGFSGPRSRGFRGLGRACFCVLEADGRIRWSSDSFGRSRGRPAAELAGTSLFDHCASPADADALRGALTGGGASASPFLLRLAAVPPAPPVELECALLGSPPALLVGWSTDAAPAPEVDAPEALRVAEVRLQAVLDNAPIGIWTWEDWKVTYFSRSWAGMLGREQPPGAEISHWAELLVPEDRERVVGEFRAAVRAGNSYEGEARLARADGTRRHVWTRALPVHDLHTGQLFYQGFTVDITERRELEERLRQAQRMEAVAELAGRVAHDFGTLLGAISSQIQIMQMGTGPEDPLQRQLDEITRAADHAGTLIRQLMAVSRRQGLERTPLDLNRVIGDLRRLVQRVLEPSSRFVADLAPELRRVYADPGQVEQVLLSLWLNARDAMPGGGDLTVRTRNVELGADFCRTRPSMNPGSYVELTVRDTGSGMDAETRARLFEPYYSTGSERGGLGLAMAYGFVRQHEGWIDVESTPGAGTTVRVYLAAIVEHMAVSSATPAAPVRGGDETILVGEDDPLTLGFTESALQGMGYRVLSGADSEEVLQLFRAHAGEIDLVVLDVVMPSRGGREVAREIRLLEPQARILFVSGYLVAPEQGAEGWPRGAGFLAKPFSPTALGRKVREELDREGSASA
ncbi:MAG: response regulator [Candidatus Eisenbacteria bacterium]|nr:response regulator [Candidatus Eisenbacteria bacterium]